MPKGASSTNNRFGVVVELSAGSLERRKQKLKPNSRTSVASALLSKELLSRDFLIVIKLVTGSRFMGG